MRVGAQVTGQEWALEGLKKHEYVTRVHAGNRRFMLLGKSVYENPGEFGVTVRVAPDDYHYVELKSEDQIARFRELAVERRLLKPEQDWRQLAAGIKALLDAT